MVNRGSNYVSSLSASIFKNEAEEYKAQPLYGMWPGSNIVCNKGGTGTKEDDRRSENSNYYFFRIVRMKVRV